MSVELRDLRWALVASQHRSLRQAAAVLNVRQSTLSRRLRDLECRLGANLFERTNGGTRPTIAGQEFLETARCLVEDTDAAIRMVCRDLSGAFDHNTQSDVSLCSLHPPAPAPNCGDAAMKTWKENLDVRTGSSARHRIDRQGRMVPDLEPPVGVTTRALLACPLRLSTSWKETT